MAHPTAPTQHSTCVREKHSCETPQRVTLVYPTKNEDFPIAAGGVKWAGVADLPQVPRPDSVKLKYPGGRMVVLDCHTVGGVVWETNKTTEDHRDEFPQGVQWQPGQREDDDREEDHDHDHHMPPPPPPGCYWVGGVLKCC